MRHAKPRLTQHDSGHHTYDPDVTFAVVGDIVVFTFFPTNRSVVRGEYAISSACSSNGCNPYVPFELIYPAEAGISSQNILTQTYPTAGNGIRFIITVTDLTIWIYCTAIESCQKGIVAAINPADGASIDQQKKAAIAAPYQLEPGQPWPVESASSISTTSTVAEPTASDTQSSLASHAHINTMSGRVIAAIVVGTALFAIVCIYPLLKCRQIFSRENPASQVAEQRVSSYSHQVQIQYVDASQWDLTTPRVFPMPWDPVYDTQSPPPVLSELPVSKPLKSYAGNTTSYFPDIFTSPLSPRRLDEKVKIELPEPKVILLSHTS